MRNTSTIRGVWGLTKRRLRLWRGRLRRDRGALALVMMLSLAIFEPLLCIVSCQLWMSLALSGNVPAQHQHQHQHMHTQAASIAAAPILAHAADAPIVHEPTAAGCSLHIGYPSGSPLPATPSPLHETLLTLALPLFVLLLAVVYLSAPLTEPPRVFVPILLRPPIPIAG
jgi:hypothetical protein